MTAEYVNAATRGIGTAIVAMTKLAPSLTNTQNNTELTYSILKSLRGKNAYKQTKGGNHDRTPCISPRV